MRDAGGAVKTHTIAVLPGDGIGPEVIAEAERAIEAVGDRFGIDFTLRRFPIGAAGVAAAGGPFSGGGPAPGGQGGAGFVGGGGGPPPGPGPPPPPPPSRALPFRPPPWGGVQ